MMTDMATTTTTGEPLRGDHRPPPVSVPEPLAEPVVVEPSKGLFRFQLRELIRYHELFFFLTWRDVKVRYKQTALGVAWAILQPLLTMVVFTIFFGRVAGITPPNDI